LQFRCRRSLSAQVSEESEAGIRILRPSAYRSLHKSFLHRFLFFFTFMFSSFWAGLWVKQVDIVWGTSPPIFQSVTAWLLARLKGAKFLFEVRDLWPEFAIAVGVLKHPVLIALSLWLERFLYRRADRIVVNSPGYRAHVLQRGGLSGGVEVIPNGADPTMFHPEDRGAEFRARHGLSDSFVVLYAGAHGMSNDLGVALQAAARLQQVAPQVRLVLVGDGKEKPNLQKQALALNLTNVLFLPAVPKAGMAEVLAAADACLAILKPVEAYKLPYPNKVFDYMAAGRPILLAIDGVIREVVESAGCGLFVPPGDPQALAEAIVALTADPERARQMGLAGRAYLETHFNRRRLAEHLLRILEELD
ncbi:MAG: glycosyltransferase family 4 protein, partial [Anaerolineales bacterium]|nr:glycosyltransferase family 4 protein [Anaerolineales bacterium]